jgi:hypothetical protein
MSTIKDSLQYLIIGAIFFVLFTILKGKGRRVAGIVIILFISASYLHFNLPIAPTVNSTFYTDVPIVAKVLNDYWSTFRISDPQYGHSIRSMIKGFKLDKSYAASNIGAIYELEYAGGFMAVRVREIVDFIESIPDAPFFAKQKKLDLLNIQYIITQKRVKLQNYQLRFNYLGGPPLIYENMSVLPRFIIVHKIRDVTEKPDFFSLLQTPDFEFSNTAVVVLSDPHQLIEQSMNETYSKDSNSLVRDFSFPNCNSAKISILTGNPGYLCWLETYMPGWNAYINTEKRQSGRVNYFMKGIPVGPGDSSIDWVYEPYPVCLGIFISLTVAFIISFFYTVRIKNNR